jgi:hypothetical protein
MRCFRQVPDATLVATGTGSVQGDEDATVPAPAGTDTVVAGGCVPRSERRRNVLRAGRRGRSEGRHGAGRSPLFADAFASYAVRFGSYC